MKRGLIIANLLVMILIVSVLFFYSFSGITGNAVFTPTIPTSCSDEAIKSTWDSIFKENSTGIIISSNTTQSGKCNAFTAYKTTNRYTSIIVGADISPPFLFDMTIILAVQGNFTNELISLITNINNTQSEDLFSPASNLSKYVARRNGITLSNADTEFKSVFYASPSNWQANTTINGTFFYYDSNETIGNRTKTIFGMVSANNSLDYLTYVQIETEPSSCAPNWTARNTSCLSNERFTQYFTDSNSCNQVKENNTYQCDYDNNGIIGNLTTLTSRIGLVVYSNSSLLNLSANYSRKYQLVQFKSGNNTIVEFSWNFSQPLNLDGIIVEKQSSSDTKGYILTKGIPVSKKVFVDRTANYSKVCVKNSEIASINDLSQNCDDSGEIILDCPSTVSGISCAISGNFFQVEGLTSSAVREFQSTSNCAQNWNCTSWSACISKIQTRTCADRNNCNNLSGKPIINQSCVMPPPPCTSNWNCSEWMPEKCPKNKTQYQICNDKNLCNSTSNNKKTETQDCEYKSELSPAFIAIITVIAIFIIIVFSLIIYLLNKKPSLTNQEKPVTQYGYTSATGY